MQNVLSQTLPIRSGNCDLTGRWKPSEIFMAMQEVAGDHCAMLGASYDYLRERSLAFALTRSELRMERYPRIGEKVILRTWAAPVMKWMFPRYFLFETESGERLGCAGTVWVLLDLNERKMVAPAAMEVELAVGDLPAPMKMPARADAPAEETPALQYLPGYGEIDVNGHVNNTRYVAWACDALGIGTLKERFIRRLVVNYSHEILPGQPVLLRMQREGDVFRMSGEEHFTLSGELSDPKR